MLKDNWEDKQGINLPTHTPCLNNNLTGPSTKINVATLTSSGSNFQDGRSRFHINQPTSIEPVSFKQQSDNQFHDQPNHSSETHAQQPAVDSNLQQLITFLSSKYGPMKTPLEIGTPEYMKLVEILKQSSVIGNGSSVEELSGSYSKDSLTNDIKNVETASFTEDNSSTCGNNQVKITSSEKNVEQLWEGSLQLSSSVTLSATAFFKSGEKLVGNHWPDFIEVKGKVRLEAFEKYVQDLPRSRTRGLMVISICWNEKSSSIGLNGMKEVAKGYKKSCKVGFAQLLSGIDLYICPRSDPIITILAKYGFFKGMSVIDDKPDSMIGCVVWRKNRPLNPVTNKSDDKNSPNFTESQNSPPGFSSKQQTEKSESSQHDKPLTSPLTLPLTSACVEVDRDRVCSSSSSSPLMDSVNLVVKKRSFQDDDLPEFDFFGGKSTVASKPIKSPEKLVNSQLTRIPLVTNAMPEWVPPKVNNHPLVTNAMPEWVPPKVNNQLPPENNNSNNNNNNGSLKQLLKKTKLFDDDDMPEWRPPEVHNQQPPQNTASTFQNLPLYPPLPPLPRPQSLPVQLPPPPPPIQPPLPPPPPVQPPPPPPPPLRPQPPRGDTRSSFYNQPFRPLVSSQPPVFLRPPPQPLPPPPQLRPQPPSHPFGRFNSNQVLWHQPPFPPLPPNGRRPQL